MTNTAPDEKAAAVEAYNSVVASAELNSIKLISTNFLIKPEYFSAMNDDSALSGSVKRSFGGEIQDVFYNAEMSILGGQFEWSVEATLSRKKILQIKASYIVTYENVPDVGKPHYEAFIKRVGKFATYPYFRSLVSQLSWESGAELPLMPVLK